jgi:hypothetical protein
LCQPAAFHSATRFVFTVNNGSARVAASVEVSQFGIATGHSEKPSIAATVADRD